MLEIQQCSLANPEDPTNSTYIVCEDLGSGIWRRSDMHCPDQTIFYQDAGQCLDVCWTDETVEEMCRAISDECGTVDCNSVGCQSEKWEAESSCVEFHYCQLVRRIHAVSSQWDTFKSIISTHLVHTYKQS